MPLISKEHLNLAIQSINNILSKKADKNEIIQSNWNQNDENKIDYIKNKPFYWYEEVEVILPETTYITKYNGPYYSNWSGADITEWMGTIEVGNIYKVFYNHKEYEFEAKEYNGIVYLGNIRYGIPNFNPSTNPSLDTGESFVIKVSANQLITNDSAEVTLKIIKENKFIKQLDEKFIPDTIVRKTDIENYKYHQIVMIDDENGFDYIVRMRGGQLISYCANITNIAIASPPNNMFYNIGDTFDPTGIVVVAECADGSSYEITDYTYPETVTGSTVTISYLDYNVDIDIISLIDFEYTKNEDGTYTLTDWKQTLNGKSSTICVIPDSDKIIL